MVLALLLLKFKKHNINLPQNHTCGNKKRPIQCHNKHHKYEEIFSILLFMYIGDSTIIFETRTDLVK